MFFMNDIASIWTMTQFPVGDGSISDKEAGIEAISIYCKLKSEQIF